MALEQLGLTQFNVVAAAVEQTTLHLALLGRGALVAVGLLGYEIHQIQLQDRLTLDQVVVGGRVENLLVGRGLLVALVL